MVKFELKAGSYNQYVLIKYVTLWDGIFKTAGVMRYAEIGLIPYITDVSLESNGKDVKVYLYPHNKDTGLEKIAEKHEEKLLSTILETMKSSDSERRVYSFLFSKEGEPRLLEESDFGNFSPSSTRDDMFIFSTGEKDSGFPNIFLIREENKKGNNYKTLRVMTASSGGVVPPVRNTTVAGKEFTYVLYNSFFEKKYTPDDIPSVVSIDFPTRRDASFPRFLNVDALQKFSTESIPNNLKVIDGKLVYEEEGTTKQEKKSEEKEEEEVFGLPPAQELENILLDELLNQNSISLGDAFQLGLGRTLALVPFSDVIVPIHINMADTAKKMCIYEGLIHIVPLTANFDPEDFFGEPGDMFHVCTEETFPKPALPSGNTEYIN